MLHSTPLLIHKTIFIMLAFLATIHSQQSHYLDQVDLMLSAEGLHELDVHGLVAVGSQDAEMGLTPAKLQPVNSLKEATPLTEETGSSPQMNHVWLLQSSEPRFNTSLRSSI